MGRCDAYATEFDLEAEEYVPLPKGVHKKKEIVQDVTLHDLDNANAEPQGGQDIMSVMGQMMKSKKTEITEKLRQEINKVVNRYIDTEWRNSCPACSSSTRCTCSTSSASGPQPRVESSLAPIVIFATNRGICEIKGTDMSAPHGVPVDLLDRLVIIRTLPYTAEEMVKILAVRAATEGCRWTRRASPPRGRRRRRQSAHAVQLLTPAAVLAKTSEGEITLGDLEECGELFLDAKASAKLLTEQADKYLS